jgi:hypothetical protein
MIVTRSDDDDGDDDDADSRSNACCTQLPEPPVQIVHWDEFYSTSMLEAGAVVSVFRRGRADEDEGGNIPLSPPLAVPVEGGGEADPEPAEIYNSGMISEEAPPPEPKAAGIVDSGSISEVKPLESEPAEMVHSEEAVEGGGEADPEADAIMSQLRSGWGDDDRGNIPFYYGLGSLPGDWSDAEYESADLFNSDVSPAEAEGGGRETAAFSGPEPTPVDALDLMPEGARELPPGEDEAETSRESPVVEVRPWACGRRGWGVGFSCDGFPVDHDLWLIRSAQRQEPSDVHNMVVDLIEDLLAGIDFSAPRADEDGASLGEADDDVASLCEAGGHVASLGEADDDIASRRDDVASRLVEDSSPPTAEDGAGSLGDSSSAPTAQAGAGSVGELTSVPTAEEGEGSVGEASSAPRAEEDEGLVGEASSAPMAEDGVGSLGKASSAPRAEDGVGSVGQSGLPAAQERELRLGLIELIANTQYMLASEAKIFIVPATQVGVG